jgi:phage baseplate assembly protein W
MSGRIRTIEEVGEDLDEIKQSLADLSTKLDQRYVPRELYEAKHEALRQEIAREVASLRIEASSARALALWCFGLLAGSVVVAVVAWAVASGGGAA